MNQKPTTIPRQCAPRTLNTVLCSRKTRLVGDVSAHALAAQVAIAMPLHNQAETLRRALKSALAQRLTSGHCVVILLNDQSTDGWQLTVQDLLENPAVVLLESHCGTAAHARNAILDFIDSSLPEVQWVARLDPDDLLCSDRSVDTLRVAGDSSNALFSLGSNYLTLDGAPVTPDNIADPRLLLNPDTLTNFIDDFCHGRANNELPSCNLLLRARTGIRYPLLKSAEDHWLVAQLLMFRPERAAITPLPVYCRYALNGATTADNHNTGAHRRARESLASAAKVWRHAISLNAQVLGYGMEGCVLKQGDHVIKLLYPDALTAGDLTRLSEVSQRVNQRFPAFEWSQDDRGLQVCRYLWKPMTQIGSQVPKSEIQAFLLDFAKAGFVACNIKRENLRIDDGRLVYIDIGRDIRTLTPSLLLDSAARLYATCALGMVDGDLARRPSYEYQHESLTHLSGFEDFYRDLIEKLHPLTSISLETSIALTPATDVTLLIKACPQDYASLLQQVRHIVAQLSRPRSFSKVVLVIDSHVGSYLRQFAQGDLQALKTNAALLLDSGVINDVWIAPVDKEIVQDVLNHWFGIPGIRSTHTRNGAPLFAQLWAFGQVSTRYVLQADVDVLIGRKDGAHDYLSEMLTAIQPQQTWCVGFNIPKKHPGFTSYQSRPEGFVPEIRLGLLDLQKIRSQLPLANTEVDGTLLDMWHRSMEMAQFNSNMQSVRGGDDRTFYLHPPNDAKSKENFEVLRDLIGQGIYPNAQAERWDLVFHSDWVYPKRAESLVFLLKGRNTPRDKLSRCLASLKSQTDQEFGVILIDDASDTQHSWSIGDLLGELRPRTTLVRRETRRGYIPNFLLASKLCEIDSTLIVVLDQDDVLMTVNVVTALKSAVKDGVDLINGMMFRPNKPTRLYLADYDKPREKGGGNTWSHLRAFKKSLFDEVPIDQFKVDGDWIDDVSDYATMLPMAELAKAPVQLTDQFYVWHERPEYSVQRKLVQDRLIAAILARNPLKHSYARTK